MNEVHNKAPNKTPSILVAPNGARRQKTDNAAIPLTIDEIAETARACKAAGADAIHLHVRELDGEHSLDADFYRQAIDAVLKSAPNFPIQITTESAGKYSVAEQLDLLENLKPKSVSIAVREIARDPNLANIVYSTALDNKTTVQHILYSPKCLDQLMSWFELKVVPLSMRDVILVFGQYVPARAAEPDEIGVLIKLAQDQNLNVTVCAFGQQEQECLVKAAKLGCDLRVGFENNIHAPDGSLWRDNATSVASLRSALDAEIISST